MSTLWKTGRALHAGLGVALVSAFALVGCAAGSPASEPEQAGGESIGEVSSPVLDVGKFRCTLAGGSIMGTLVVRPDESCHRYDMVLIGTSGKYCPGGACGSCWTLARDLQCILDN